ncbi:MAG: hypothetical protein AAF471_07415, partial [Myxococcota bacterium]
LRSTTGVPEGLGRRRKKRGERAQRVSWQHEVRREEAGEAGEQEQGDRPWTIVIPKNSDYL